jgi:DNA-binding transcriptional ArsR family regulator
MKLGPQIAELAALVGDPARANMLCALLGGTALTASELALEAGVTKQTASSHLARLLDGKLVRNEKQGRHRYFALADADIARLLEMLMGISGRRATRVRTGPAEPALRRARVCYDHLAGDLGVALYDSLLRKEILAAKGGELLPTREGSIVLARFGIDTDALARAKRPLCRSCLDWSVRRQHLAGGLGAALLDRIFEIGWARRVRGSRIVAFTARGESALRKTFEIQTA